MLETMAATDMLPYVRYSRASVIILWLAVLAMPVAIFSTTLLYIVGPLALLAMLFFNVTFIALGNSYVPTEELLDKEAEKNMLARTGFIKSGGQYQDLANKAIYPKQEQNPYNNYPRSADLRYRTVLTDGVPI